MKLPKYVRKHQGWWKYSAYTGTDGKGKNKPRKLIPLCRIEGSEHADIWREYLKIKDAKTVKDLSWLLESFIESDKFKSYAFNTQKTYITYAGQIKARPVKNASIKCFGDMNCVNLTKPIIQRYVDAIGKTHPTKARHHLTLIRLAFKWAINYGELDIKNPCIDIYKPKARNHSHCMTDTEFETLQAAACPRLYVAMWLCYESRGRGCEAREFKWSDVTEDGLIINRSKGSKTQIIEWSPSLRNAIKVAKTYRLVGCDYIVCNRSGKPYTADGFQSQWYRLQKKTGVKANFHSIKHKAVSDFEGDKVEAGGWKDARMVNIYDHSTPSVRATTSKPSVQPSVQKEK